MINILIVDDSATETALLRYLFEAEQDMKVIGCAKNGEEGVHLVEKLKPDIITMDIRMPVMNGFDATRMIMTHHPTPIVVISSVLSDPELSTTFQALEAGALSVIKKPHNNTLMTDSEERKKIIDTVRSMAEIKVVRRRFHTRRQTEKPIKLPAAPDHQYEIIGIGSSVGGPQALHVILEKLPADFPVPIVIVQHMTQGYINGFAHWLNKNTKLKIKSAESKEVLLPGTVYFAPDQHHLVVIREQGKLLAHLTKGIPVSGFCPSATTLLKSLAKVCGKNAIGIILTGMGHDGAEGLLELKNAGGYTLIQDEESAVVFGMAGTAKAIGAVNKIVPLQQMAHYLMRTVKLRKE